MAIELSDLLNEQRTIEVSMMLNNEPKTLRVTYLPGKYTPELESQLRKMREDPKQSTEYLCEMLAELLVSWDLMASKGVPFEIDKKTLTKLPFYFLNPVMIDIAADMRPNPKSESN